MAKWRWDQGRLSYFQFDEIKLIAAALLPLEGKTLPSATEFDILRESLAQSSALPFAPARYTVWRNYGRVFGCQLLATEINRNLHCTDLCKLMATDSIDVDDYFLHLSNNFYYPSPIFEGYNTTDPQVFPMAAVLKLLLAKSATAQIPMVSTKDVFDLLVANNVQGTEDLDFYIHLTTTPIIDSEKILFSQRQLQRCYLVATSLVLH